MKEQAKERSRLDGEKANYPRHTAWVLKVANGICSVLDLQLLL